MSEWKKVRLGEVVSLVIDHRGKTPKKLGGDWAESGYRALSAKTVKTRQIVNEDSIRFVGETMYHEWMKDEIQRGDILVTSEAPYGEIYYWDSDEKIVLSQRLFGLRIKPEYDSAYVAHYMTTTFFKQEMDARATGTTVFGLRQPELLECNLMLPPLPTQRKIAAVLSSLDDKIENNRKICANLEAQAQAIFKSWFVDFEPFGGKMPQGWKAVPLSSIATYLNGLAMQKYRPSDDEDSFPVLKIKELRQGFCDAASERCSVSIDPRYVIHDGDVIFSWSGSLLVDFWCGGTAGLNQHLFKVYSNKYDKWFVYSWTNHYLASFIKIAADKATTMGHITRDHLDDAKVCIPFDSEIEQVGRVMKPLYDEIITKRIESRSLAAMRDALLPKLMSGEIDVEKVKVA